MFVLSSSQKGAIAEAAIALEAMKLGISVLRPMMEGARYDLVLDVDDRLVRVQCKLARRQADIVSVPCRGSYYTPGKGYIRSRYTAEEIDGIAAYCPEMNKCFWIPIERCANVTMLNLRLTPTRNGQRAAVNMAGDFPFGAVAQLEVALAWHARGRGFESRQLHSPVEVEPEAVGANIFRNQFGWYMQRASRGESFEITRRGKPFARLQPPTAQLALVEDQPAVSEAAA